MSSGFAVDPGLLLGGIVLVLGVVGGAIAGRLRLPGLLLFMGLGMVVADDGLALVRFDDAVLAQNVAIGALAIILFQGGLSTDPTRLRRVAAPAISLATIGVVVTAGIVALAATWLLGLPAEVALLLGAIIASTDAAAVFDVLADQPLPSRVRDLLQAESGLNDPVAVLLTVGFTAMATSDVTVSDWVVFGLRQLLLGLGVGFAVGLGARWVLRRFHVGGTASLDVLALAFGAVSYGAAAVPGGSGFLAIYVTGLVIAGERRLQRTLRSFHEGLASTAQAVLFVLLGLLVFPSRLLDDIPEALAITAVLLFVARPIAVYVGSAWLGYRAREMVVISWSGLRGAVPIVLATVPFAAGYERGQFLFDVVFVVVVVTLTVQAPTIAPLARRLGVIAPAPVAEVEVMALENLDADLVEITLGAGAPVCGRELRAGPPPDGSRIAMVVRGEQRFVPAGDTMLERGDLLLVVVPPGGATDRLFEWATGVLPAES
jgi:potassium/hydrogen antiporter